MPGIAGLISLEPADVCQSQRDRMITSMQHEKFHVSGTYSVPELGVFAGWVTLEGTYADCQPVLNDQGDVAMLLSGECLFDEPADAKTVLQLYERRGDEFFERLNGLFSGLLIDRRRKEAFLFNDRYGLERIYYHGTPDRFYFASEAKALLRVLPELRAFDNHGLAEFLRYGCTLPWNTVFRDIKILPGASVWRFRGNQVYKRRYFHATNWESQAPLRAHDFADQLEETFTRVLPRYFRSDARIGISLTGGIDTRMIIACRPHADDRVVAYTFASEGDTLDVRIASRVAAACGVSHHVVRLTPDFFSNFASVADRTVYVTDGCWGICGAHEIYLHEHARALAPVRLTGNYGSEILRGVTTFKPVTLSEQLLNADFIRSMPSIADVRAGSHPVSFAAFAEIPLHLFGSFRAAQSQVVMRTPYLDNELVALAFRVPQRLRTSAWPAIQVIRRNDLALSRITTDSGLVPSSAILSMLKRPWYRATFKLDYWRTVELPGLVSPLYALLGRELPETSSLLHQHRFLRYRYWFRTKLRDYVRERLSDPQIFRSALWNRHFVQRITEDHINGRRNHLREIDAVLTCSSIERLLLNADV